MGLIKVLRNEEPQFKVGKGVDGGKDSLKCDDYHDDNDDDNNDDDDEDDLFVPFFDPLEWSINNPTSL